MACRAMAIQPSCICDDEMVGQLVTRRFAQQAAAARASMLAACCMGLGDGAHTVYSVPSSAWPDLCLSGALLKTVQLPTALRYCIYLRSSLVCTMYLETDTDRVSTSPLSTVHIHIPPSTIHHPHHLRLASQVHSSVSLSADGGWWVAGHKNIHGVHPVVGRPSYAHLDVTPPPNGLNRIVQMAFS